MDKQLRALMDRTVRECVKIIAVGGMHGLSVEAMFIVACGVVHAVATGTVEGVTMAKAIGALDATDIDMGEYRRMVEEVLALTRAECLTTIDAARRQAQGADEMPLHERVTEPSQHTLSADELRDMFARSRGK